LQPKKIIVTNDAINDEKTQELVDIYLGPNKITCLMGSPIEGKSSFESINGKIFKLIF
jgi:hypothetical protein